MRHVLLTYQPHSCQASMCTRSTLVVMAWRRGDPELAALSFPLTPFSRFTDPPQPFVHNFHTADVNAALIHVVGLLAAHTLHVLQTSHAQRVVRTGLHAKPVELEGMGGITSVWLWAALQVGYTMTLRI